MLRTITISATVDDHGNANFTYDPSVLHVYQGDTVQWQSNTGPFAVQFKTDSPFVKMEFRHTGIGGFSTEVIPVRSGARGHFHYAAAITMGGQVYVDCACPEIIAD
jgi:plastocyanin